MNYEERHVTSAINYVTKVIPQKTLITDPTLSLKPDYVVHGDDWKEGVQAETRKMVLETLSKGRESYRTKHIEGISSIRIHQAIHE